MWTSALTILCSVRDVVTHTCGSIEGDTDRLIENFQPAFEIVSFVVPHANVYSVDDGQLGAVRIVPMRILVGSFCTDDPCRDIVNG